MPMSIPTQQVETEEGEKRKIIPKNHQKFSPACIDKAFSIQAFMGSIKEFGYKFAEIIFVLEMSEMYYKLICFLEDCWEEEEGKRKKHTGFYFVQLESWRDDMQGSWVL